MNQTIRLKLFARFAEAFRADEMTLSLPSPVTLHELRAELTRLRPDLSRLVAASAFAVNEEYTADEQVITASDEVAIIPPVSGGGEFEVRSSEFGIRS